MYSEIYWINEDLIPEKSLGIMARPRGHDWLEDEIKWLKIRDVNFLISLLESSETYELGLHEEASKCSKFDIDFVNYQIEDVNVPSQESQFIELVLMLRDQILNRKNIVIHCRMGIGRSSLLAACILISLGIENSTVFDKISKFRGVKVPDTQEQIEWVNMISNKLK